MITLKDVSLKLYIDEGLKASPGEQHDNAVLLKEYNIYNCADLLDYVKSGDPRFQNNVFLKMISLSSKNLQRIGVSIKEPPIYTFDNYDKYPNLKEILEKSDSYVGCDSLPIFTPIDLNLRLLKSRVEGVSIARAREYLKTVAPDMRNSLSNLLLNLTGDRLNDIANGIKFYEEQIIRIVESTPSIAKYNGTIFYKDSREKRLIIESILEDIILYISSLGEDFIWGKLSDNNKTKLLASVKRKTILQETTIENFIRLICDYVTLQELEEGIIEHGTLKRFVIEPRKKKTCYN